ncbi:site-specific integrase [Hwanghaeella grinnelliae]|uniref:Site-specific integrase n=1 Tax=Hwanghaeella grinnelliae TaxID=2500179 RepID=A0A437QHA4_9PROT|nr:site-specific integrase [Hwanghaeella grinnelliae]RVU33931.1 site-specific integrase [Hwanghaeella grinnelliae]
MSVYPPPPRSPYWTYDFTVGGTRFRGSTKRKTKREAEKEERRLRQEAETNYARGLQGVRLNEAFGRYLVEKSQYHANADTEFYQLERLKDGLGDILIKDIPDALLSTYVSKRRSEKTIRGTLPAPATVNREIELLRRVLRTARDEWGHDVGRLPKFGKHKLPEPQERIRSLSTEEQDRLMKALWPDLRPVVSFSLATGVRLSNAIGLTWNMVDLPGGTITLRTKSHRPGGATLVLPITNEIRAILSRQRGQHPIHVFTYECRRTRLENKRVKGERYPFSLTGWRRDWKRALKAAGIEDYRWHDNRHTAATRLLATTGNLKLTQRLLGHSDIATTAKYAHADTDQLRDAMEEVSDTWIKNSP